MTTEDTTYNKDSLPAMMPIFPLEGVLLLPGGQLPLHIFEDRYKAMVEDSLKAERLIGMIQPRTDEKGTTLLYDIGCAGKIQAFEETQDGRYYINLGGISRFRMTDELPLEKGYRRIAPDWQGFEQDLNRTECLDIDRGHLTALLNEYFAMQDMDCDWDAVAKASDQKLITCLSMICPFESGEKQALLEAECCNSRANIFMTMLEMAVKNSAGTARH